MALQFESMSNMAVPVELPTGRSSYADPVPGPDKTDPNWIPVLDSREGTPTLEKAITVSLRKKSSAPSFATKAQVIKQRRSMAAPEKPTELDAGPLPPRSSSFGHKGGNGPSVADTDAAWEQFKPTPKRTFSDERRPVTSDGTRLSGAPSTVGTASLFGDPSFPVPPGHEREDGIFGAVSARSSMVSSRKPSGALPPTSKYSRKGATATNTTPSKPATSKSQPPTPRGSPRLAASANPARFSAPGPPPLPFYTSRNAEPIPPMPTPPTPSLHSRERERDRERERERGREREREKEPTLPLTEPPVAKFTHADPPTPKLGPAKSTAAERKLRALNSHPSNVSLKIQTKAPHTSHHASIEYAGYSTPPTPNAPAPPRKSTDSFATTSRSIISRSTYYDAQAISPVTISPIPQMPHTSVGPRPPTRDGSVPPPPIRKSIPPEALPPLPSAFAKPGNHTDMASFMTNNKTVVFRRFDDIHVRLLLTLQDEIASLEQELFQMDNVNYSAGEMSAHRTRVLQELRRVVAEYDHLFANWSQMQANKASNGIMRELRQWLSKPSTSAEARLGRGAKQDLEWLEKSKDLSAVNLGPASATSSSNSMKGERREGGGGGGGGWCGCFGSRK